MTCPGKRGLPACRATLGNAQWLELSQSRAPGSTASVWEPWLGHGTCLLFLGMVASHLRTSQNVLYEPGLSVWGTCSEGMPASLHGCSGAWEGIWQRPHRETSSPAPNSRNTTELSPYPKSTRSLSGDVPPTCLLSAFLVWVIWSKQASSSRISCLCIVLTLCWYNIKSTRAFADAVTPTKCSSMGLA